MGGLGFGYLYMLWVTLGLGKTRAEAVASGEYLAPTKKIIQDCEEEVDVTGFCGG